jgi:CheY-like chemotaxis protein
VKVLVIDDNTAVLEVIALMLASDGHTVATAAGGPDGLARLAAGETADLVLTDLGMPEMSGWDVVKAVSSRWPAVRVGLMTGTLLSPQDQQEPVDVLLTKPMTLEQLCGAVAGCAGSKRCVILVVPKRQADVYEHLRHIFQADTQVEVVMDRRRDLCRNPAWVTDRLRAGEVAVIRRGV